MSVAELAVIYISTMLFAAIINIFSALTFQGSLDVNASIITFVSTNIFIYFAFNLSALVASISASFGKIPNNDFAVSTLF